MCVLYGSEEGLGVMRAMIIGAALWLIAAIRLRQTVSESGVANEKSTARHMRCRVSHVVAVME